MKHVLPFGTERIAVVAITRHGIAHAGRAVAALPGARLFAPEKFRDQAEAAAPGAATCFTGKTGDQVSALFSAFDGLVCVVSLGAVVRLIAPHLQGKGADPAVVVLDEGGRFAIPVLSGHIGGANALAARLAEVLAVTPVFTTASDCRETLAVDLLGREFGWIIEAPKDKLTRAAAAVVNDEPVAIVQEAGEKNWWTREAPLPANLTLFDRLEAVAPANFAAVLWISRREFAEIPVPPALADKLVAYRPPLRLALGLGCDRDTPAATIADAVDAALDEVAAQFPGAPLRVAAAASIDLKADEAGLLALAAERGWTIAFHPAATLATVVVPNPSETVRQYTGTPSVSEAAALIAAGKPARTTAAPSSELLVEKLRRRGPDGRHATVSIARISP